LRKYTHKQAAPYVPGDSKAGASQEGWTEDQIEKILQEEKIWKEQVAAKEVPFQLLRRNVQRFRGGLVFKAHRL